MNKNKICEDNKMVKGVNRQVLEIHETGCEYFEKALFFAHYCHWNDK